MGNAGICVVTDADVAQLVAHHLAKVRVAGSNPVVRSRHRPGRRSAPRVAGGRPAPTAAWPSGLGKGLQSPVRGFDSRRRLELTTTAIAVHIRAISSVGEHYLDTVGVTGSIPVSPTPRRHETALNSTFRHSNRPNDFDNVNDVNVRSLAIRVAGRNGVFELRTTEMQLCVRVQSPENRMSPDDQGDDRRRCSGVSNIVRADDRSRLGTLSA